MSQYWEIQTYEQPTEAKLKKNASESMKKDIKRGKENQPVVISGKKIAKTWWGEAWCENLERYADYESRLDRGKRYVRTGAVIDLVIKKGKVLARVQGRRKAPYKVEIRISPISEERCQNILEKCGHKIENLETLINGGFPEDLKSLFVEKNGLFPLPKEISFQCSCPDWALMCKHVAAVLYGIGARFDENPLLFFELRGIDVSRFVDVALENKVEKMLQNAERKSERIMETVDYTALFGVEL